MTQISKLISTVLIVLLSNSAFALFKSDANEKYYQKFKEVFEKIEKDYVKEPKKQELLDSAIEGMLSSLDPHSGFFADDDLEFFVTSTKGEFGGIGVEIVYENSAIKIISPIDDLPAYKVGMKAGDYIVKVNNELVSNLGFNKSLLELRGKPGTTVKVTVLREGENKPLDFEITREIVKINAVKSNIDNNILYLRVSTFSEKATQELLKEIKTTISENKDKIEGMVLDLRNNPGGLLEQAISVSDLFIKEGIIVSTKGRDSSSEVITRANPSSEKAPDLPMIVLINGGSASSSEIVAAALQENRRALLLGTKTYGKGSIQTFFPLDARSAFKFTTGLYYTPKGISIQAEGITPDIVIEQAKVDYPKKDDDKFKFSESSFKNHLKNEQSNKDDKNSEDKKDTKPNEFDKKSEKQELKMSDLYMKDFQYARAYDLMQGIIILEKKKNERK
jgi:carboxyl-terminal processing protease